MKKLLLILFVLLSMQLFADYNIESLVFQYVYNTEQMGQSFTTLNAGNITSIMVYNYDTAMNNTTLRVFNGESVNVSDEIYNEAVTLAASDETTITLRTPVPVLGSTVYTFAFDSAYLVFSSDAYAGGKSYIPSFGGFATYDLYFRVGFQSTATPGYPSAPSPATNAQGIAYDNNPDISWTNPGDALFNYVYFSTSFTDVDNKAAGALVAGDGTALLTNYNDTSNLAYSTTYYWRIVEGDNSKNLSDGEIWEFRTTGEPVPTGYYTEGFESATFPPQGWTSVNSDGDAFNWVQYAAPHNGSYSAASASWDNGAGALTPDNWLISPQFSVSSGDKLMWWRAAQDPAYPADYYDVKLSTTDNALASFTVTLYSETISENIWDQKVVDLSSYAGNNVYIAFEHHNCTDMYVMKIDDVSMPVPIAKNGDVLFSEVCDNKTGEAENTGFIELFNKKAYPIDLSGDQIKMGTAGNNYNEYTYTIPANTIIAPLGYITIANGATLAQFDAAWYPGGGSPLTASNFFSDSGLAITSGKAYAYNTTAKSVIDETPVTVLNGREVRKSDKTWDGTTTNGDGTPGETSGTDEPLPEELVSFMAVYNAEELTVMWTTASEFNLISWNIYRAPVDNFTDANAIGSVDAQGTSTENHEYVYNDNSDYVVGDTYYYWIESIANDGTVQLFGPTSVTINEHNNPEPPAVITYGVENYPNPFNPRTMIRFALRENEGTNAKLDIYNIKGQFVKELRNGKVEANKYYRAEWDGTDMNSKSVASGVYFYKLTTDKKTFMKKMLLLK